MLNFGTLEETAVYKDLYAQGYAEGYEEGYSQSYAQGYAQGYVQGRMKPIHWILKHLDSLFQNGVLPEDEYRRGVDLFRSELDDLEAELERLTSP